MKVNKAFGSGELVDEARFGGLFLGLCPCNLSKTNAVYGINTFRASFFFGCSHSSSGIARGLGLSSFPSRFFSYQCGGSSGRGVWQGLYSYLLCLGPARPLHNKKEVKVRE